MRSFKGQVSYLGYAVIGGIFSIIFALIEWLFLQGLVNAIAWKITPLFPRALFVMFCLFVLPVICGYAVSLLMYLFMRCKYKTHEI